jgi:uncharacterized membrane protein (UPF0127 family)
MDQRVLERVKRQLGLKEIEIASSPWKLGLGLMFRGGLAAGSGMLFDFHYEGRHAIWMAFMRFPVDIYFLDSSGSVMEKMKAAKPLSLLRPETWKTYRPKKPCRYAVEVACRY